MAYVVLAVLLLVAVIAVLLGAAHAHANKVARETGDPEQTTTFWL